MAVQSETENDPSTGPTPAPGAPPSDWLRAESWRNTRRLAYLAYIAVVVGVVIAFGVPTERITLILFVLALLAITCIGRGRRAIVRMLLDWLPFAAVLLLYDQSRRLGDKLGLPLHEADIVHAEKWLFGGTEPTIWLQHHLYTPGHVHWYDALCTLVYTSHFLATPILAAILWLRERAAWLKFVVRVIALSVAGLITYCLFPEAPPWLAAKDGITAPVYRLSAEGWVWLHAGNLNSLLARAQDEGSNPVAAMPSLHTAFATTVAIAIASRIHSRWRWLLVLYPIAMGFTLVYDGEHYVLDLAAGVVYALGVHWLVGRWEQRRAARRTAAVGLPADPAPAAA